MSIAKYRQKPISEHSAEERKKYAADVKRRDGSKMKKGKKVLINLRGKNKVATIDADLKPNETSILVVIDGRKIRKDLATFYGFVNEKPEEAKPPEKLLKLNKSARPRTPKKLLLEAKAGLRPKTPPPRPRTPNRIEEAVPPNIDNEIATLMKISDSLNLMGQRFSTLKTNKGQSYVPPPY